MDRDLSAASADRLWMQIYARTARTLPRGHARPSTGSVGDAYGNGFCENLFATLECELLERRSFRSDAKARIAFFDFVAGSHNRHRRHSAFSYQSPVTFEDNHGKTTAEHTGSPDSRRPTPSFSADSQSAGSSPSESAS